MWKSKTDPKKSPMVKVTHDGRLLVLDDRGFWIAANINKSVPSWEK